MLPFVVNPSDYVGPEINWLIWAIPFGGFFLAVAVFALIAAALSAGITRTRRVQVAGAAAMCMALAVLIPLVTVDIAKSEARVQNLTSWADETYGVHLTGNGLFGTVYTGRYLADGEVREASLVNLGDYRYVVVDVETQRELPILGAESQPHSH